MQLDVHPSWVYFVTGAIEPALLVMSTADFSVTGTAHTVTIYVLLILRAHSAHQQCVAFN